MKNKSDYQQRSEIIEKIELPLFSHLVSSINSIEQMRKAFESPMREYTSQLEQMRKTFESPMKGYTNQLEQMRKAFESPMREYTSQLEQMRKTFESPMKRYTNQLEQMKMLSGETVNVNELLRGFAINILENKITINDDGSVLVGNEKYDVAETKSRIEKIILNREEKAPAKPIEQYFLEVSKKHPVITFFLLYFLLPFVVNVFSSGFSENIRKIKNHDKKAIEQIKYQVSGMEVSEDFFKHYRIITTECLTVRKNKARKSQAIGYLYTGEIVRLVGKAKNWSLIEYRNNSEGTEVIIKGWVFSRYLDAFNK